MTKLVLLTGFLGAGKTTFMNRILKEYHDCKTGLIVNEFAGTSIDGTLIERDKNTQMIELTNGSIFCACIKNDFVNALIELVKKELDYVFVEASGLADPSSITSLLDSLETITEERYEYMGSICLVDALYFERYVKVLPALRRQIEYSKTIIINKIDLVEENKVERLEQMIRGMNNSATILKCSYADISLRQILHTKYMEQKKAMESSNTYESRPYHVTLVTDEIIKMEDLAEFIQILMNDAYRIKGFVKTSEGTVQVSAVGETVEYKNELFDIDNTKLVIISRVGVKMLSIILKESKIHYHKKIQLKF